MKWPRVNNLLPPPRTRLAPWGGFEVILAFFVVMVLIPPVCEQLFVSTGLGAEGIEAVPGRDILIEDHPEAFADAVNRLLAEPGLATRMGQSARQLAVEKYAWRGAAQALEGFYRRILEARP